MAMPGMSQGATAGNPALTLVLALFMLGYVLWATDRLAGLSRAMPAGTARGTGARLAVAARRDRTSRREPSRAARAGVNSRRHLRQSGARPPVRRLLQDRHGHRHGVHARHDALN